MAQKTETLAVRLTPELKAALREVAILERRSMANMLEVMIAEWFHHYPQGYSLKTKQATVPRHVSN